MWWIVGTSLKRSLQDCRRRERVHKGAESPQESPCAWQFHSGSALNPHTLLGNAGQSLSVCECRHWDWAIVWNQWISTAEVSVGDEALVISWSLMWQSYAVAVLNLFMCCNVCALIRIILCLPVVITQASPLPPLPLPSPPLLLTVRQYADICLFSTAQYKCPVAQVEAEWVPPSRSSFIYPPLFVLTRSVTDIQTSTSFLNYFCEHSVRPTFQNTASL